jgi:hypothetical protein
VRKCRREQGEALHFKGANRRKSPVFRVPRQFPLVLPVNGVWGEGKGLGSEEQFPSLFPYLET